MFLESAEKIIMAKQVSYGYLAEKGATNSRGILPYAEK
jgi:hypothetical protein